MSRSMSGHHIAQNGLQRSLSRGLSSKDFTVATPEEFVKRFGGDRVINKVRSYAQWLRLFFIVVYETPAGVLLVNQAVRTLRVFFVVSLVTCSITTTIYKKYKWQKLLVSANVRPALWPLWAAAVTGPQVLSSVVRSSIKMVNVTANIKQLLHEDRDRFNVLFSRTTWVCCHQKGYTNLDFNDARNDRWRGISWTIFKSFAPLSGRITMPAPRHSIFTSQMLFLTPS